MGTVVGGFAVYVRITDVHRVTNDLDTVSHNQPSLIEILVAEPHADRLAAAKPHQGTSPARRVGLWLWKAGLDPIRSVATNRG